MWRAMLQKMDPAVEMFRAKAGTVAKTITGDASENREAGKQREPDGVDVSSEICSFNGIQKDPLRISSFMSKVNSLGGPHWNPPMEPRQWIRCSVPWRQRPATIGLACGVAADVRMRRDNGGVQCWKIQLWLRCWRAATAWCSTGVDESTRADLLRGVVLALEAARLGGEG
ncbi:hypothetical protein KSP39_PZI005756 [Platanthera zijinensis]|uniref:Uncharacterized protein n=1 Tax=Platanthera zijinensis TaxID=2320716 RepID=A0AAP0BT24_9ASPA